MLSLTTLSAWWVVAQRMQSPALPNTDLGFWSAQGYLWQIGTLDCSGSNSPQQHDKTLQLNRNNTKTLTAWQDIAVEMLEAHS